MAGPTIDEIAIADAPERWARLGFAVDDDALALGGVRLRLAGVGANAGRARGGMLGWSLRDIESTQLDGLPTMHSDRPPPDPREHPNGALAIDHVVAFSPELDRTVAALEVAGLPLRRIREEPTPAGAPRQAFFRVGAEVLEVIQEPPELVERHGGPERPAVLWGLALTVRDLDAAVSRLGEHAGLARDAVQPGRRIAPLRRSAGLAVPVALMSAPR